MERKKLAIGILVILLVAGVAGVSASIPDVSSAQDIAPAGPDGLLGMDLVSATISAEKGSPNVAPTHGQSVQGPAAVVPVWQQVNSNGFGVQEAGEVSAVAPFNGYLYAGTSNPTDGARIFRSPDGTTWTPVTDPGFGNPHDSAPPAILDLEIFNTRLYASTGRGNAGQIWRTLNGTIWAPVDVTGFSDPDNVDNTALAEYGGKIYAGVGNQVSGAQIWSSFTGDNNSWTKVGTVVSGTIPASVTGFAEFAGGLHAAIEFESDAPAQIWRSYGGPWEAIVSDGFGDSDNALTGGMAVFGGYLYVGAGNTASGAQLWRTNDGTNWGQVITPAFGDSNNEKVEMVYVFENQLYVSVKNSVTGIEIWRSTNGTLWEQVNEDGFGDSNNSGSNWSNATAEFLGQLYVGTSNVVDGGELRRMKHPYDVALSPDDALSDLAGTTVTYTLHITNTGTMSDTFDLSIGTHAWTTTVSTSTITLVASASASFTVTVDIPGGAAGNESDSATITATSQGDGAKIDTANLTTTVTPVPGIDLSPDDALSDLAGATVKYTLIITNTGNAADTFDLTKSGQIWPTSISTPSIALAAKASASFTVTVDIPGGADGNDSDAVTIKATSQSDGAKNDTAMLTTTVPAVYGVKLSTDDALSGAAGTTVTYTLQITNDGNLTDSYLISVTGETWTTTLSTSNINLAKGASTDFFVYVEIPGSAAINDKDSVTIIALSQGDFDYSDEALLTTTYFDLSLLKEKVYMPLAISSGA